MAQSSVILSLILIFTVSVGKVKGQQRGKDGGEVRALSLEYCNICLSRGANVWKNIGHLP